MKLAFIFLTHSNEASCTWQDSQDRQDRQDRQGSHATAEELAPTEATPAEESEEEPAHEGFLSIAPHNEDRATNDEISATQLWGNFPDGHNAAEELAPTEAPPAEESEEESAPDTYRFLGRAPQNQDRATTVEITATQFWNHFIEGHGTAEELSPTQLSGNPTEVRFHELQCSPTQPISGLSVGGEEDVANAVRPP